MTPRQTIGQRVRDARVALGLTLRDIADKIGVSHVFLSNVEHGRSPLPVERREAFADALGLSINELTELDGPTLVAVAAHFGAQHQYIVARELRKMARDGVL